MPVTETACLLRFNLSNWATLSDTNEADDPESSNALASMEYPFGEVIRTRQVIRRALSLISIVAAVLTGIVSGKGTGTDCSFPSFLEICNSVW